MPLPIPDQAWPPAELADLTPKLREWAAWWTGDAGQLLDAYGGTLALGSVRPQVFSRWARVARSSWSRQIDESDDDRMHIPLAADLCAASAELVYTDPPQLRATTQAAQTRVDEYAEQGLFSVAAAGNEAGAAFGGHYLQAVYDPAVAARPFLEALDYDGAWPTFTRGRLTEVAFWWTLDVTGGVWWRHFESHTTDPAGNGIIQHALYQGTDRKVGARVDLRSHPFTAQLVKAGTVDSAGVWQSGTPGMDVVHIPNRGPQKLWRLHPLGRHLGRSDLQGQEEALSRLDDAYSSWMRDIDLGRARLVVADYLLDALPGGGASFDVNRRLMTPVHLGPTIDGSGPDPIRQIQFAIRMEEHRATCQELTEVILRSVGYSPQTFGEDETGGAQTATGVLSKDSRSMRLRRAKIAAGEGNGLQQIVRKLLAMDQAAGGGPVDDPGLTVVWPEGAEETPLQMAQTVQALRAAEAASDETIVEYLRPDWDTQAVAAEVARIQSQRQTGATLDAITVTTPPDGGPDPFAGA